MIVPHHSEPAREAVACLYTVQGDSRPFMRISRGMLHVAGDIVAVQPLGPLPASPAPAAGGLEAVAEAAEPFRRLLSTIEALWAHDRFTDEAPVYKMLPDPRITVGDLRKLSVSVTALASPAATSAACQTCNGHGMIGGWSGGVASIDGGGGYVGEPCPDCTPAAATSAETQGHVHPDDIAVDRFAAAMKAKLAKKRTEGRGGWEDKTDCSNGFLSQLLVEHVDKGDPVDVGNLAMMIHQRGETIADERERYAERVRQRSKGSAALAPSTSAAPVESAQVKEARRVRHKKRGGIYEVLGEAEVQISGECLAVEDGPMQSAALLREGDNLVFYRCEQTGKLWCRLPDEFEDGRFEDIRASLATDAEG